MSKTGGYASKLLDKEKRRVLRKVHGTYLPMIARSKATFAEKQVALLAHKRLIQVHAINLGCRVTTINKDGDTAVTFRGDGLPQEGYEFGPEAPGAKTIKPSKEPRAKASKPVMVVSTGPKVAKWSRRGGFAG